MNLNFRRPLSAIALLSVVIGSVAIASVAIAQAGDEGRDHGTAAPVTSGPHGGTLRQTGGIQIETVVSPDGIEMYVFDRAGQPAAVRSRAWSGFTASFRQCETISL